mgnify:CR=1 FL=1
MISKKQTGQKLWNCAKKIIPGGNMLLSKRAEMFLPDQWPAYFSKAKGCKVWDLDGNEFNDMSIMGIGTNILGYGHPEVDEDVMKTVQSGNMSTFNCPEEVYLAEKLVEIAPPSMDQAYLWTTGSETIECAFRLAREWGSRIDPAKTRLASIAGDYHGCTLAAHQLSGPTAEKSWNPDDPSHIHRLPFPGEGQGQGTQAR